MQLETNWAGNYRYSASEIQIPETVAQLQELVARSSRIKVLGTRHSFNGIADSTGTLLSLQKLNRVIALDEKRNKVTVEAGIRYGELSEYLHSKGYALHNLASLPHITVAGACATASHGSGDLNGNLATAVHSFEIVKGDGEVAVFSRETQDGLFAGAVVGLGALGAVTRITLDIIPDSQMCQHVYENLPLMYLKDHFDDIFSSAYSVSLFTNWNSASFNQVWLKRRITDDSSDQVEPEFYGATLATAHLHPVPGHSAESCSEQMGIPGPWFERLPHFRMDFVPSAGKELQTEYFVPRKFAYQALCSIDQIREYISPLLYVSEVRTIEADHLWMSPCYKQNSVAIHFTWKDDWEAVQQVLPKIEKQLEPFHARPHWGKLFTMPAAKMKTLYEKLPDFQKLILRYDPQGKFSNAFLNEYILRRMYNNFKKDRASDKF